MESYFEKIEQLYKKDHVQLKKQVSHKTGCSASAADIVQDVFLRFLEKKRHWQGNPSALLNKCASNAAIDHLRSEQHAMNYTNGITEEQYSAPPLPPSDILEIRDEVRILESALEALPTKTRHIFLLNRIHNRSFSEIARVMNMSERAVAKHIAKAMVVCERVEHK